MGIRMVKSLAIYSPEQRNQKLYRRIVEKSTWGIEFCIAVVNDVIFI